MLDELLQLGQRRAAVENKLVAGYLVSNDGVLNLCILKMKVCFRVFFWRLKAIFYKLLSFFSQDEKITAEGRFLLFDVSMILQIQDIIPKCGCVKPRVAAVRKDLERATFILVMIVNKLEQVLARFFHSHNRLPLFKKFWLFSGILQKFYHELEER